MRILGVLSGGLATITIRISAAAKRI